MTCWKRLMQDVMKHQLERLGIPHCATHQPSKSGKIGVVFDCSAEFEGKTNKELLPGPDLTDC